MRRTALRLASAFLLTAVAVVGQQTATTATTTTTTTGTTTAAPASGQPNPAPPAKVTPPNPAPVVPPPDKPAPATPKAVLTNVTVVSASHYLQPDPDHGPPKPADQVDKDVLTHASLDDNLEVRGTDFKSLVQYADENSKSITLYLNGSDTFITPSVTDPANNRLVFHLERNTKNKDLWTTSLLHRPYDPRIRQVLVSVGVSGGAALPSGNASFNLVTARFGWDYLWLLLLVAVLWWFFSLVAKHDLLRDGPATAAGKQAYSLGRSQMAWWFFLIIIGFVFIWLISGDRDSVTPSLLMLMGISSATALGSRLVDTTGAPTPPSVTQGSWLKDILTDSTGTMGLHRFQIVIWTLVLGVVFFVTVFTTLSMPTFNDTLVSLMGISSGTYLGFKFQEK
jgi:hypothetical protein